MIYTRVDALLSLKPTAQFNWAGTEIYSELNYLNSDTPPTESELDAEVTRLNNLVAIISTGRQAYINQLGTELNKKEVEFED